MCGIVGYVGYRPAQEVLLAGLERLEYRGYDSAGISLQSEGRLESVRAVGNLSALRAAVESADAVDAEDNGAVAVAVAGRRRQVSVIRVGRRTAG
jgi:glucosamine--fructose-6-phosphate aminotransferase (isomerizing)